VPHDFLLTRVSDVDRYDRLFEALCCQCSTFNPSALLRRSIAAQLIRNDHAWAAAPFKQLAHQPFDRSLVAALHQHIEHRAMLVGRPPQPVLFVSISGVARTLRAIGDSATPSCSPK
jgi:hypothetical protein